MPRDDPPTRDDLRGGAPPGPEGVLSLPNLLTLVRLPLAAMFWWLVATPWAALLVLVAAGLSDMVDGWFARRVRRWRWERRGDVRALAAGTAVGAWLDPLCDKVFVVTAVAALAFRFDAPLALLALLLTREVLVVVLLLGRLVIAGPWRGRDYDFTAGWPGKATTVVQFAAIALLLYRHPAFPGTAGVAAVLGAYAPIWHARRAVGPENPQRHGSFPGFP